MLNSRKCRWTHPGVNFNRLKWMLWPLPSSKTAMKPLYIMCELTSHALAQYCKMFAEGVPPISWRAGFTIIQPMSTFPNWFVVWVPTVHCKDKMPKIWNKYSQKRNIGASVPISTFSELYIPTMGLPVLLEEICRLILEIYISLKDTGMWKLGLRPRYSQKRYI